MSLIQKNNLNWQRIVQRLLEYLRVLVVSQMLHIHTSLLPKHFTDVLGNFGKIYKGGSEEGFHGADCYYGTWNESDNV